MTTTAKPSIGAPRTARSAGRTASVSTRTHVLTVAAGTAVAIAADAVIATSAVAAGASATFGPLTAPAYVSFTVVGMAAAYAGWRIVRARATRPDRALRVLVPLLAVLSFIPDGILLATGFIPGSSPIAVAGLALMHLVVVAVAVPVLRVVAPVVASAVASAR